MFSVARGSTYLCTQEVNFQADDYGNCNNGRCSYRYVFRKLYIFQMHVYVCVCTAKGHLLEMNDEPIYTDEFICCTS